MSKGETIFEYLNLETGEVTRDFYEAWSWYSDGCSVDMHEGYVADCKPVQRWEFDADGNRSVKWCRGGFLK